MKNKRTVFQVFALLSLLIAGMIYLAYRNSSEPSFDEQIKQTQIEDLQTHFNAAFARIVPVRVETAQADEAQNKTTKRYMQSLESQASELKEQLALLVAARQKSAQPLIYIFYFCLVAFVSFLILSAFAPKPRA